MLQEPKEISSQDLENFITSKQICILRAKNSFDLGFNSILQMQFEQYLKDKVQFGWVNISKLNYTQKTIKDFIQSWIVNIGLPPSNTIYPGYYLFKEGKLLAFHPGIVVQNAIDEQTQNKVKFTATIFGLIFGFVKKDLRQGIEAFMKVLEAPQAFKVFNFFKVVLENRYSYSKQRQSDIIQDEVEKAFKLIGVSPSASDDEIKKVYRSLQLKYHPDRSITNKEALNKFSAEINNAYETIEKFRSKNKVN